MATTKSYLSKGLDSLFAIEKNNFNVDEAVGIVHAIPIEKIHPSAYQPRKVFSEESLKELSISIKQHGIIHPLTLRIAKNGSYEIVAGERRWRAAKYVGLSMIPAILRDVDDSTAFAFALVENLQREDLNAIDEAQAIERLYRQFSLSHQQIAEYLGKARSSISNTVRLLSLNTYAKEMVSAGKIDKGQAKLLVGLPNDKQTEAVDIIIEKQLTVKQTEYLVKRLLSFDKDVSNNTNQFDDYIKKWESKLNKRIKSKLSFKLNSKGAGCISIYFTDTDEANSLVSLISGDTGDEE